MCDPHSILAMSRPVIYIYMSLLSRFPTNDIKILAEVNGAEVSQAIIVAISVVVNDLSYLPWPIDLQIPQE